MILWRLSRFPSLDGIGGVRASARWHNKGRPVIYAATSPAGALIEVLVHLDIEPGEMPDGYRLLGVNVPDAQVKAAWVPKLPKDWRDNVPATRKIGSTWLAGGKTLLCTVPSAIIDETVNYLVNPRHPDVSLLKTVHDKPFAFDPRLI